MKNFSRKINTFFTDDGMEKNKTKQNNKKKTILLLKRLYFLLFFGVPASNSVVKSLPSKTSERNQLTEFEKRMLSQPMFSVRNVFAFVRRARKNEIPRDVINFYVRCDLALHCPRSESRSRWVGGLMAVGKLSNHGTPELSKHLHWRAFLIYIQTKRNNFLLLAAFRNAAREKIYNNCCSKPPTSMLQSISRWETELSQFTSNTMSCIYWFPMISADIFQTTIDLHSETNENELEWGAMEFEHVWSDVI